MAGRSKKSGEIRERKTKEQILNTTHGERLAKKQEPTKRENKCKAQTTVHNREREKTTGYKYTDNEQ